MRLVSLAVLSLMIVACRAESTTQAADALTAQSAGTRAELRQPFELKIGETATVGSTGLRVTFTAVESDSRCPIDALCVWAGDAATALKLERSGRSATAVLHTNERPKQVEFDGFDIVLVTLQPANQSATPTRPDQYRAHLVVNQR